jgi:hypothetical protein
LISTSLFLLPPFRGVADRPEYQEMAEQGGLNQERRQPHVRKRAWKQVRWIVQEVAEGGRGREHRDRDDVDDPFDADAKRLIADQGGQGNRGNQS